MENMQFLNMIYCCFFILFYFFIFNSFHIVEVKNLSMAIYHHPGMYNK